MKLLRRLRALFRKDRLDREMSEEMRAHLELQAAENERRGMTPDEARYAARRAFGGEEQIKERCRDQRGWAPWDNLVRDFFFARRSLAHAPGFALIAIITLALGIGMNTAMFGVLNGLLLRPLTFPRADRLFFLDRVTPQNPEGGHSLGDFEDMAKATREFAALGGYRYWVFNVSEPGQPAEVPATMRVTANFFSVLGIRPLMGRAFLPREDQPGNNDVIVISHFYWQSHFGGDPAIIGRRLRLDGTSVEIVGVMPEQFERGVARLGGPIAIYRPYAPIESERADRKDHGFTIVGRYADGVTPVYTLARLHTLALRLAADHPAENEGADFGVRSMQSATLTGGGLRIVWLLVGLSGAVLLIACANLANLLLARALSRAREFSIRAALGASRAQLVRPLAAECVLLALAGGALAALVSAWITAWVASKIGRPEVPVDLSADGRVLVFMLIAATVTVFLFGVGPAWWVSRIQVGEALKRGGRTASDSPAQQRYRQGLIGVQFAFALVLLGAAALFIRGLNKLARVDIGWEPETVISGSINSPVHYSEPDRLLAWQEKLQTRLRAIPGVENVAVCFQIPLFAPPVQRGFVVEGRTPPVAGREPLANVNAVTPGYFDTVGMRLLRGRRFDERDQRTSPAVVMISESMARALFPGEEAIGRRIGGRSENATAWAEIVGIVADTRPMSVAPITVTWDVYKPYPQEAWQYVTVAVRAANSALAPRLLDPVRQAVAELDPDLPVQNLQTVPQKVDRGIREMRLTNELLLLFAGLGLFLAAFGIYGVIARLVAQRTNEIGIRLALGARAIDILRLVLGRGVRAALGGITVGFVGVAGISRLVNRELPGLGGESWGPITIAAGILLVVALLASLIPARRAARVDPIVALRCE